MAARPILNASWSTVCAAVALLVVAALFAGCGGTSGDAPDVVAPSGAPYRYVVPGGFEGVEATYPSKGPRFATTAVPSVGHREGYLGIYEVPLGATDRALPGRSLLARFERVEQTFYRSEGATLDQGRPATIAGRNAICWRIHHFQNPSEGLIEAESCAITDGQKLILQTCTWKPDARAEIRRGCEAMRASLRLF